MSDVFEPFDRLIEIAVFGRTIAVPDNNTLLRQLQYACPEVATGPFCWNADCRKCEVEYSIGEGKRRQTALACRMRGVAGLRLLSVSPELRFALSSLRGSRNEGR